MMFAVVSAVSRISFAGETKAGIEIIATPQSGKGPLRVHMAPKVNNLKGPLRFRWYFGDGQESEDMAPKPHLYDFGKYNLVLEVTDRGGKQYTAGICIDASLPG